ncbi:hypothetical protein BFP72_16415 [Reichenbachiella sp. 5M10]|uniref:cytochrome P450 n=1 Tax=Reichenbachiella sp. 5M10 TaxID=1889772 RepID=UPI000C15B9F4|nr:cytochrome P450 [Reichenbachiella sp. 5M10]PIB36871.1 hypothetical protein BFP72_16415 [Reichenbachiella sp. 5M10]
MKLTKAFPDRSPFKNLKPFQASPILYMKEAANWGSPVDLNLPMGDFVLISDPEHAHYVLATNHQNYVKSRGYKEVARVLGQGLLTAEGEFWHKQRKLLQPSFHKPELKKLLPSVWDTAEGYLEAIASGGTFRVDTEMSGLTLTVLLNSLIRYQHAELRDTMSENIEFAQEFIVDRIRSPFKWPVWVPTKTHRRYHYMVQKSNELIQQCVDARRAVGDQEVNDLLAVLLEQHDGEGGFVRIRDEMMTFLFAGHETSALSMTWTLHLLAHFPDVQAKLYAEVGGLASLADLDTMNFSNLKYTQQVIMEAMRYYPPIWNIVRRAVEDDVVGGVEIPRGKQLMINIYQLHHNSQYWDDPEQFRPERFAERNFKHKFQYLPFGAGPRFCIGNNFALLEITILLVQFVRAFELKPLGEKARAFNPLLTLRPEAPIELELVPR